jgi:hypothetical protein
MIESRIHQGVILTSLYARLYTLLFEEKRKAKNAWEEGEHQFVIRRWYSQ